MERVPFREWDSFFRSCFKFIPRQIETYVEADWSPRCETGAQYGWNIPACNDNIISQ